jgi:predicted MFS family arabinose efflux permease
MRMDCITVTALFLVGSLISATAQKSIVLILGRAIAGVGAGGIYAGNLIIVALAVPLHRRPAFLGVISSTFAVRLQLLNLVTLRSPVS